MYIVVINIPHGKVYLKISDDLSSMGFGWVTKYKQATKFNLYREAREAMRLAVPRERISDATIIGYH